uniref:Uncharacterized protein n=1 Tax=Strigamia maritima TaxID=126957 RepID=T1J9S0_STRMM
MYAKGKGSTVPSDAQAREKLALYVYEYLLHVGAQKAAQTFLSEIRWEKNITLGEPPGFLHSWWCVFWDLYCAAPERRDTCDHSSEAKAFHDYSQTSYYFQKFYPCFDTCCIRMDFDVEEVHRPKERYLVMTLAQLPVVSNPGSMPHPGLKLEI